jgi:DNA-binding SARP family transcriptional activator
MVRIGGVGIPVQRGKQRAVLAALLLNAGQVVSLDELSETLWGPDPPPSARVTIQNYVMRLRKTLGQAGISRISTLPSGYAFTVDAGELDVTRFEDLLRAARSAARERRWQDAAEKVRSALSLWRGDPLADVGSGLLADREVPRLAELRLQALETRIDADLHLGRHTDVITELQRLTACHPLRERLYAQQMLALYRDGRQAEALAVYQRARQALIGELGTEPGPGLREMHQQILAGDPALAALRPSALPLPTPPRELPAEVPHFTGRDDALAALTELLHQSAGTMVVSAISGTAGVGKTALAVHWAHQVAGSFPDGQLYVNLRGYDPSGAPLPPAEAIRGFLDALGVPAAHIPAGPDAQAGLYRSLLAGRRMLILLDNARDAAQVRPLLPGSEGCLVLVTSRSQLTGLAAADGAHLLTVDELTHAEARTLLSRRLGAERVGAEPAATAELITICARLPLALNIAAARSAARPNHPLAAVAAALRGERDRLDAFDTGEPASSARTVFSWSYRNLGEPAARMFRLLGLHPGPDITVAAAASLAGIPAKQANRCLGELTATHLVAEQVPGRFSFHDLLRAYASEQAGACDSSSARDEALGRVLDHYLHTAQAAARRLCPGRDLLSLPPPREGVQPEQPGASAAALAWFIAERPGISAAARMAADAGLDIRAWQLGWVLGRYLHRCGCWQEWTAILLPALAAAERAGDLPGQAAIRRDLGNALARLGSFTDAHAHLGRALGVYQRLGDSAGQAHTRLSLGRTLELQGRSREALSQADKALECYQAAGHRAGQGNAISNAGWYHSVLGEHQQALACYREALALHRQVDNRDGECCTWDCLGDTYRHLGQPDHAIACYRNSTRLFRELGNRPDLAVALTNLGDTLSATGQLPDAQAAWREAHVILDDLHDPGASQILARLSRPAPAATAASGRANH